MEHSCTLGVYRLVTVRYANTGKSEVHPRTGQEGPEGELRYSNYSFINFGARWEWVVNTTPPPLYPWERSGTHCMGGWLGLRAGLGWCGKSRHPLGFDPRTVQPVASRYTDYTLITGVAPNNMPIFAA